MKLEKAIELKLEWRKDGYPLPLADQMTADKMSIEALKFKQRFMKGAFIPSNYLLPGETTE